MARMPLYSLSSSSSIPDSEPERTQIRTKIGISSQIPLDLDVIEIMDSDSEPGTPSGESPQVDEVLAPRFEYASIAASQPLAPRISSPLVAMNLVSSLPLDVLIAPTSEGDSANHISPRPARALQISHLAFASKHAPKSSTSRLPSTSRDTLPVPDIPKKKPASSRLKKALSELSPDFTEGEIEHVLKCIACDARWTARKSAAQKVQHMRMCCKKAFYTQETIDVLLRKAIQDAAEAPPKPNKTPAAAGPPPASPTLFTEFNPAEAKKKRGRAATIKTTVTSVLDTRSEILNRAQLFLQQDSESPEGREAAPLVTQQFGSSKLGAAQHTNSSLVADEPPPATQQLGGAKRTNSLFLSDDAPPPTQQFGQSKLGVARRATKSIFDNEEASNSEVEDGELPPSTKKNRHSAARYSPTAGSIEVNCAGISSGLTMMSLEDKSPRSVSPRKKKPTKPRSPRSKKVYDSTWEEQVRSKILEDKDLHLRILRLEPIHFDVFYSLVAEPGVISKPDAKLKRHLMAYLDKEGINFSALEKWGR